MSKLILKDLDEKILINVGKVNKDYVQLLINTKGKIVKNYENKEMQELIKFINSLI